MANMRWTLCYLYSAGWRLVGVGLIHLLRLQLDHLRLRLLLLLLLLLLVDCNSLHPALDNLLLLLWLCLLRQRLLLLRLTGAAVVLEALLMLLGQLEVVAHLVWSHPHAALIFPVDKYYSTSAISKNFLRTRTKDTF